MRTSSREDSPRAFASNLVDKSDRESAKLEFPIDRVNLDDLLHRALSVGEGLGSMLLRRTRPMVSERESGGIHSRSMRYKHAKVAPICVSSPRCGELFDDPRPIHLLSLAGRAEDRDRVDAVARLRGVTHHKCGVSRRIRYGTRQTRTHTHTHTHTHARARTYVRTLRLRKNLYVRIHIVSCTIVLSRNLPRLHYH